MAYLAARSRDVPAAEDALGDALVAALDDWRRAGVPAIPKRRCSSPRAAG
ncbi:MAG TPA: hypothetical protein VKD69_20245 [Vicinamibacterales bacterium]|nr:hypothetical protein [Vicinamibacterales bacterium]